MNCATHSDTAAVAFCRTCGKPLCNQCTRDVRGVIYCEACLAARMEGTAPAAGFVPPTQTVYPPSASFAAGPSASAQLRPESRHRRNSCRSLSHRRRSSVYRPVRQGTGAPGHHGALDPRSQFRSSLVRASRSWESRLVFSTSTRSSTRFAAPRRSSWANLLPIPSDWRKLLAPARNSKAPKFPPEPLFSSAWACSSCCILPGCLNSAWIVSGR